MRSATRTTCRIDPWSGPWEGRIRRPGRRRTRTLGGNGTARPCDLSFQGGDPCSDARDGAVIHGRRMTANSPAMARARQAVDLAVTEPARAAAIAESARAMAGGAAEPASMAERALGMAATALGR